MRINAAFLTASRKLSVSSEINCRSEKCHLQVEIVLLSVYSSRAKLRVYVSNGKSVFLD